VQLVSKAELVLVNSPFQSKGKSEEGVMKTYIAPAVAARGDVVGETLNGKPIEFMETANRRVATEGNLSFGL
jgi:hypothetical protein